jgi:hypothetical protein
MLLRYNECPVSFAKGSSMRTSLSALTAVLVGVTLAVAVAVAVAVAWAAPDRKAPPNPYAVRPTKLDELDKSRGARFGDWAVWRYDDGGPAVLLVHQHTGTVIYMPWSSNGWLNFRDANGKWFVVFSSGTPDYQKRDDLKVARYVGQRPAAFLIPGQFTFDRWSVTVAGDTLELKNSGAHNDHIIIRATTSEFTHNGRSLGGKL